MFAFPTLGSDGSFHNFPVNRFTVFDMALFSSRKEALPYDHTPLISLPGCASMSAFQMSDHPQFLKSSQGVA